MSLLKLMPVAAIAAVLACGADQASAEQKACGFDRNGIHSVSYRKGVSCEEAKSVLRKLRGAHDFVPMACGHSRVVDGWRIVNLISPRKWTVVESSFTRGAITIHYQRHQFSQNITCPGEGLPLGADG